VLPEKEHVANVKLTTIAITSFLSMSDVFFCLSGDCALPKVKWKRKHFSG
jgi:hypothetical protein